MRLLDRYLLRECLVPFAYCLAGFWIFWTAFDIFAELDEFQEQGVKVMDLIGYYAIKSPEMMVLVVPVALLLALLYALTNHARHQELTAMRAAGISLWRLAAPYLAIGFILSALVFTVNELWVPVSIDKADAVLKSQPQSGSESTWERRPGFTNVKQKRTWFMEAYNTDTHTMVRPVVHWQLPTGALIEVRADLGVYRGGIWAFSNAVELTYPAVRGEFPFEIRTNWLVMRAFTETPAEIQSAIKISKITDFRDARRAQLSLREILSYKGLRFDDRANQPLTQEARTINVAAMLDTKLHGRLAAPWTCLVVVLIALPFGAMPGRRNVFVGVASSIIICFGYFVLSQLGLALGAGAYLPAWLGAWGPNVFFAALGISLASRIR